MPRMPSTVLRDYREADAPEINRLALAAFDEYTTGPGKNAG